MCSLQTTLLFTSSDRINWSSASGAQRPIFFNKSPPTEHTSRFFYEEVQSACKW